MKTVYSPKAYTSFAAVLAATIITFAPTTQAAPPAGTSGSTRGETEFPRPRERNVENEYPEDLSTKKKTTTSGPSTDGVESVPSGDREFPSRTAEKPVVLGRSADEIEREKQEADTETGNFMTVHVNPITSLLGLIYADAMFSIGNGIMVGPSLRLAHYDLFFLREESFGIGARAQWFASGPYKHSFYVATTPLYSSGSVISEAYSARAEAKFSRFYLDLMGGYQFHWKSFNIGAGIGIAYNGVSLSSIKGSSGDLKGDIPTFGFTSAGGLLPTGEFTMGWSF